MGLAPAQPDQEVIDGLLLDAAWKHAQQLESELRQCRVIAKQNHESLNRMADRRLKMAYGMRALITRYEKDAQPGTPLGEVLAKLQELVDEEE